MALRRHPLEQHIDESDTLEGASQEEDEHLKTLPKAFDTPSTAPSAASSVRVSPG